jgi:predicted double-glycine peptidase
MTVRTAIWGFIFTAAGSVPLHTGELSLQVPFIHQQKNGCGAASVAMLLRYWNAGVVSPDEVYQQLHDPRRKGIALADMKRYLENAGYHAFTFRGRWADLEEHLAKGRPIIVALKPARHRPVHFAVLAGLEGEEVWLNDPTRKSTTRAKSGAFQKQWDNADRWMLLATPEKTRAPP